MSSLLLVHCRHLLWCGSTYPIVACRSHNITVCASVYAQVCMYKSVAMCVCVCVLMCVQAVIQYMRDYRHTSEHFVYISSNVYWVGAYVLADMMATEGEPWFGVLGCQGFRV